VPVTQEERQSRRKGNHRIRGKRHQEHTGHQADGRGGGRGQVVAPTAENSTTEPRRASRYSEDRDRRRPARPRPVSAALILGWANGSGVRPVDLKMYLRSYRFRDPNEEWERLYSSTTPTPYADSAENASWRTYLRTRNKDVVAKHFAAPVARRPRLGMYVFMPAQRQP